MRSRRKPTFNYYGYSIPVETVGFFGNDLALNDNTALWPDVKGFGSTNNLTGTDAPVINADGSRAFDGSGDYFSSSATAFDITGSMSIIAWVKPDDGRPAAATNIVSKYGALARGGFIFNIQPTGAVRFFTLDGVDATDHETTDAAVFSDGAQSSYTQIFSIYTAGASANVVLGVNGAAVASTTTGTIESAIQDVSDDFTISGDALQNNMYAGDIIQVLIASGALTTQHMKRNYDYWNPKIN